MDKKRLLLALIFLLVCIGLGFLIYRFFFAKQAPTPPPTTQQGGGTQRPGGEFPTTQEGQGQVQTQTPGTQLPQTGTRPGLAGEQTQSRQLVQDIVISPTVSKDGGAQFYNEQDGRFYRVQANGTITPLSDQVFYNVQDVVWSPKNTESIIEYPDGSNIYYNFDTKQQVTLPKHWEDFSFSDQGDKIAAKSMSISPENRWLITANPDGTQTELIEPLGENGNKVKVNWSPNRQVVALSETGEALGSDRQEVLLIGKNGENFHSLTVEGRGMQSEWSPTGKKLLYSVYNQSSNFKPELWIVNGEPGNIGTGRKPLSVNTWAEKCSFSDDRFVYCGVPTQLETGAGFAPQLSNSTPDTLVRIDTETGLRTPLQLPNETHVIEKVFLSEDGKTLFFTDKTKTGLFQVPVN